MMMPPHVVWNVFHNMPAKTRKWNNIFMLNLLTSWRHTHTTKIPSYTHAQVTGALQASAYRLQYMRLASLLGNHLVESDGSIVLAALLLHQATRVLACFVLAKADRLPSLTVQPNTTGASGSCSQSSYTIGKCCQVSVISCCTTSLRDRPRALLRLRAHCTTVVAPVERNVAMLPSLSPPNTFYCDCTA